MGEYARLNSMLRELEEEYANLKAKPNKDDWDFEREIDLYQEIGEVRGALLENAEIDGLDDPYEAFDY